MALGRVEQYHTHTRIDDGYKILPIPVPTGMKLYPYPYPIGIHTHWVPNGWIKYYTSYSLFTFINSILRVRMWDFDLLNVGTHVDYNQCLITSVNGVWDAQLL
jgi:hypothetical protein